MNVIIIIIIIFWFIYWLKAFTDKGRPDHIENCSPSHYFEISASGFQPLIFFLSLLLLVQSLSSLSTGSEWCNHLNSIFDPVFVIPCVSSWGDLLVDKTLKY